MNKLAIIIPAYKVTFLPAALDSLVAQTCQVCGKIFVGSDMDNVGQILRETGKYSFDPKYAGSVVDALQQALTDIPKGKEKKNRHQALGFGY